MKFLIPLTLIFLIFLAAGCATYVWVDRTDCPDRVGDLAKCRKVK